VLNRSAGKVPLFRKEQDYAAMERVLAAAKQQVDLPLLAWCFMKNHWHFVVQPKTDTQVTDFFRWLTHTHAMRWRVAHRSVGWGHLYQGRFKSFPIQGKGEGGRKAFLSVCRYVQRNALTAGVVKRAEAWRWGSLWAERNGSAEMRALLAPWPVERPRNWLDLVNEPITPKELARLRMSVARNRPYGDAKWVEETVRELGLEYTLRAEGRPRTHAEAGDGN
jgi:putative transposase